MTERLWNGRAVELVDFSIAAGRPVRDAFIARELERAAFMALILSARYADDGSPVFGGLEEIEGQPNRHHMMLMGWGIDAASVNGMLPERPDKPNGAAEPEPVGPSL